MYETRANEFDRKVGEHQFKKAILDFKGKSVLDVGCGEGYFTRRLHEYFERVVGIDADAEQILKTPLTENTGYFPAKAEEFKDEPFDTILMMDILEHVDYPAKVLENMKRLLTPEGRIIIHVPNAFSFNRLLGVAMGIILDCHWVSRDEEVRFGHKRVYDPDTLEREVRAAGLKIVKTGGILFKPLTNVQMQQFVEGKTNEWVENFLEGSVTVGNHFPRYCSKIFVVATR